MNPRAGSMLPGQPPSPDFNFQGLCMSRLVLVLVRTCLTRHRGLEAGAPFFPVSTHTCTCTHTWYGPDPRATWSVACVSCSRTAVYGWTQGEALHCGLAVWQLK